MMKHFYPDAYGLFQDDSVPNISAQGLTEWLMSMKTLHSPDLNPI